MTTIKALVIFYNAGLLGTIAMDLMMPIDKFYPWYALITCNLATFVYLKLFYF